MKIIQILLLFIASVHAHVFPENAELRKKGIPSEFLEIYGDYLVLGEAMAHGSDRDETLKKENDLIAKVRSSFPEKAGDYAFLVLENAQNSIIKISAYRFYRKVNIKNDKMLDYARRNLEQRDWGSNPSGARNPLGVLLREGDMNDLRFVKRLLPKMKPYHREDYRRYINHVLEERNKSIEINQSEPKLPSVTPKIKSMPEVERRKTSDRLERDVKMKEDSHISNSYLAISIFLIILLIGGGFLFFKKS